MNNQKGFAGLGLVIVIVIAVGVAMYLSFVKKSGQVAVSPNPTVSNSVFPGNEIRNKVLSPAGGEKWQVGKEYTIRWQPSTDPSTKNIVTIALVNR